MSNPLAIRTDRPLQVLVAQKVTTGVYKGVTTSELDDLAAETAASMTATHPDYATVRASFPTLHHCEQYVPECWHLGHCWDDLAHTLPCTACSPDCGLKPPQEHNEVLQ